MLKKILKKNSPGRKIDVWCPKGTNVVVIMHSMLSFEISYSEENCITFAYASEPNVTHLKKMTSNFNGCSTGNEDVCV